MELTPKLCRTARALLAWSQRDLAERAQTAVSTIADFERGTRTPIQNSMAAMVAAFEGAGVRFAGGRAISTDLQAAPQPLATGMAIRWIDSTDLGNWANRRDAQADLPELIGMLVQASVGNAALIRFPAGDSVQYGGWDGACNSPYNAEYVPAGLSNWEFGTQRENIAGKANGDFDKRAKSGDAAIRAATTFVFVTPRTWARKDAWLAKQREKKIFADVRALDADDIVHWLDAHPGVAIWLATKIGKYPRSGVIQLSEAWEQWSLCTQPALSENLILTGRDDAATRIHAWLKELPSVLAVQADSADEAVAFLWAVLSDLPEAPRRTQMLRVLCAASDEAVRELGTALKPLTIVMNGENFGLAQTVASKGHHVYAVVGPNASASGGISLNHPRRVEVAAALEAMGISERDAHSLARRSGASLAALRRIMAEGRTPPPHWAAGVPPRALLAALLIGSWDEESEADRDLLADLADEKYADAMCNLAPVINGVDAPLRRSGKKLRLASAQDAWYLLASSLTEAIVDKFFAWALKVLRVTDPRFGRSNRSELIALDREKPLYSQELRRGIVETLNLMAFLHHRASNVEFLETRVQQFVSELLDEADAGTWWSLRDVFQGLVEAAPIQFTTAVDSSLHAIERPIAVLLDDDGEGLFSREYVSDLTSALGRLAWSREFFTPAVTCLAGLAEIDSNRGRNGNRPSATLRQIFLPWSPQTFVPLRERLAVIDQLREQYPDVAWRLMVSLLPKNYDTSSHSSPPIWRRETDEQAEPITFERLNKSTDEILNRLLVDAGNSVPRWMDLLDSLTSLGEVRQRNIAEKLLVAVQSIEHVEQALAARDGIRQVLHRHRQFANTDWAVPESALQPLQVAYDLLTPTDLVQRERWVFAAQPTPPNPEPGHDWNKMEKLHAENRRRVARELIAGADADSIFAMAKAVDDPFKLGVALVDVDLDANLRDEVLDTALRSSHNGLAALGQGVVFQGTAKLGFEWGAEVVRQAVANGWPASAVVAILHGLPTTQPTWNLAREGDFEIERLYWETTRLLGLIREETEAIAIAAEKLLAVGRACDAIALIGQHGPARLESPLLLRALQEAGTQLASENQYNDRAMLGYYVGLALDHLVIDEAVSRADLIAIEWTYFGLLQHSDRDVKLLESALASSPEFFVDVVSSIYRAEDELPDESDEAAMKRKRAIAEQSYRLLDQWSVVPGSDDAGQIDAAALRQWVHDARTLAVKAKRLAVVDDRIGAILSASSPEPNGDWPPKPVRDVIERLKSKRLEDGFSMGTRNRRGVTTRGPLDGGDQERKLKRHYDDLAKRFQVTAPRTAGILRTIANSYKVDAVFMDRLADAVDLL